jgi:hypothetical protein
MNIVELEHDDVLNAIAQVTAAIRRVVPYGRWAPGGRQSLAGDPDDA